MTRFPLSAVALAAASILPAGAQAQGEAQAPSALAALARDYRAPGLDDRRFTHAGYWRLIDSVTAGSSRVRIGEVGRSIQGRAIRAVTFGSGPIRVLLWSQMHGDESTATMALADIITYLVRSPVNDSLRARLGRRLTVTMIPMLNPDGAEVFRRENAAGVDVNRDARRLATPEAKTLKRVRDSIGPAFGFNLHDQGVRLAGPGGKEVGIALLAPAADESRAWGPIRLAARQVIGTIVEALQQEIPGRMARYDDTFTPRAFGDLMQGWGTSTVLIESGRLPDDPQKQRLREVNVVAILTALDAIASGTYKGADELLYDTLPLNQGVDAHLLLLGGRVVLGMAAPVRVDVAIRYDDEIAATGPRIIQIGDLSDTSALDTLNVNGLYLFPMDDNGRPAARFERGAPARLIVRRTADPTSEVVYDIAK